jgi:drug/metabolite transporter (DMT)-like permease
MSGQNGSRTIGALAICAAALLWGLDGVALTPRLNALPVAFVVFLLHLVPFALMQPFLYRRYRSFAALPGREWLFLLLVSLAGGWLGTLSIVRALFLVQFNQLSVVVLLQKLQPLFAIALANLLLGERVGMRFLFKAAAALAGAYLMTFGWRPPSLASGTANAEAALWAVLAAAAFGSATVFGKRLLSSLDFQSATFGRYGMTAAIALVWLAVSGQGLSFGAMTPFHWALVLGIGVTTGSGALFLYYFGLHRVRAVVSAVCELCLPLSAILFDYWLNGSVLGPWQWLGAALLLGAISAVSYGRN